MVNYNIFNIDAGRSQINLKLAESDKINDFNEVDSTSNYYLRKRKPVLINSNEPIHSDFALHDNNGILSGVNSKIETPNDNNVDKQLQISVNSDESDNDVTEAPLINQNGDVLDSNEDIVFSDSEINSIDSISDISSIEGDTNMAENQGLMAAFRPSTFNGLHTTDAAQWWNS